MAEEAVLEEGLAVVFFEGALEEAFLLTTFLGTDAFLGAAVPFLTGGAAFLGCAGLFFLGAADFVGLETERCTLEAAFFGLGVAFFVLTAGFFFSTIGQLLLSLKQHL